MSRGSRPFHENKQASTTAMIQQSKWECPIESVADNPVWSVTSRTRREPSEWGSEYAMASELRRVLRRSLKLRTHAWILVEEVPVSTSIPDIMVIENISGTKWPKLPKDLSLLEAVILAAMRRRGDIRIDSLEFMVGLPSGGLRSGQLDRLVEIEVLERGQRGKIRLISDWSNSIRITAVEAKLDKWKKAVGQARSYLGFADVSYVAMPCEIAEGKSDVVEACSAIGIGLIGITPGVPIRQIVNPKHNRDHSWRREFAFLGGLAVGRTIK
jgi:hypothetical protein